MTTVSYQSATFKNIYISIKQNINCLSYGNVITYNDTLIELLIFIGEIERRLRIHL